VYTCYGCGHQCKDDEEEAEESVRWPRRPRRAHGAPRPAGLSDLGPEAAGPPGGLSPCSGLGEEGMHLMSKPVATEMHTSPWLRIGLARIGEGVYRWRHPTG